MPAAIAPPVTEPLFDRDSFERAWHGVSGGEAASPTPAASAQLTIHRDAPGDIADRQIHLWVDGEAWGKIRHGRPITREIPSGHHRIRANNTLFNDTLEFTAVPGEHIQVQCSNRIPAGGWLMMAFIHVTYLRVRLERITPRPAGGGA
jgi:hypothetical protein